MNQVQYPSIYIGFALLFLSFDSRAASAIVLPPDTLYLQLAYSTCPGTPLFGAAWSRDTTIQVFTPGVPDTLKIIDIDVLPEPVFALTGDSVLCNDDSARVEVGGFFKTYQWSTGATGSALTVAQPGLYAVTVTANNGCTRAESVRVTASRPDAVVETRDPTCAGSADGHIVVSNLSGGLEPYVVALNEGPFGADSVFAGLSGGHYRLTIRDATGCTDSIALSLPEPAPFSVDAGPDLVLRPGDAVRIQAAASGPVLSWTWQSAVVLDCYTCPDPLILQPANAALILLATDAAGCTARDTVRLSYRDTLDLFVPNAFAPGRDDSDNALLRVAPGPGNWQVTEFSVYDRWGNLLFQSQTPVQHPATLEWDGRVRGRLLTPGVYLWMATLQVPGRAVQQRTGDVAVVR